MCVQAEKMLKQAYKAAEISYRKSQTTQHQNAIQEALHRECPGWRICVNSPAVPTCIDLFSCNLFL